MCFRINIDLIDLRGFQTFLFAWFTFILQIDKEKKKSLIAEERYRRLEGIMEDERRRFTRDEKLLLERCDQLDKSVHL